jgi:hypothetical protein
VQVHDGEALECGSVCVGDAAAEAGHALHGNTVGAGLGWRESVNDGQGALELVDPLDPHRTPALSLDRWPGTQPAYPQTRDSGRSRWKR